MADIDAPLAWRMQQDGYLMQINQLRDENAKLCQQLADVTESVGRMEERCAKLREQVRELWSMAYLYAYDAAPVSMQALMRVEKELQALGIEVDKWVA